jgi:glycosyltransferase involved in cell wall biosynthesis
VFQPRAGGVPTHVLALSRGLVERGWEVEAACPRDAMVWGALRDAGVKLWPLPLSSETGVAVFPGRDDARAARMLRELDDERRYAIVHAHSSRAGGLVRTALPHRERLFYNPHCFAFTTGFSRARRVLYGGLEQMLVARTGCIVATCEWEREEAARLLGGGRRTEVVANGARACLQGDADDALAAFADGRPLVGMVAELRTQKDPLALVHAVAALAVGRDPGFRVAIVGNGPLAREVEVEIECRGLARVVRRFPFEAAPERYLRALDLFVLPSRWEAFPIATLEAMACGTPVLATDVGGMREQVVDGDTGRLVPANDGPALRDALDEAMRNRARLLEWGANARRRVAELYTVDRLADRMSALYARALGGGPPPAAVAFEARSAAPSRS